MSNEKSLGFIGLLRHPSGYSPIENPSVNRLPAPPVGCSALAVTGGSVARAIAELQTLREWVKRGDGYNRDDAPDEIARAIENRIAQLKASEATPPNTEVRQAPAGALSGPTG